MTERNQQMEEVLAAGHSVLVVGGERPAGAWDAASIEIGDVRWLARRANAVWVPALDSLPIGVVSLFNRTL